MFSTTPLRPLRRLAAVAMLALCAAARPAPAEPQKVDKTLAPAPRVAAKPAPAVFMAAAPAPGAPDLNRAAFIASMDAEYRRRDAHGDGRVTRAELEQWERSKTIAAAQASNRALFARLDVDRNGVLSPGEFAAMVKDPGVPDVGPLMTRFDGNRDQVISLVEFRAGTLANFDKLDADHDGVVTGAEMKAAPTSKGAGL